MENAPITSPNNPIIKHIHKLQTQKKYRYETNEFILENPKTIKELTQSNPNSIKTVLFTDSSPHLPNSVNVIQINKNLLSKLSQVKSDQGIIAVIQKPSPTQPSPKNNLVLYLNGIQIPQNLGTIFRNAAAFGVDHIVLSRTCVDPYHPDAIRAMAGSLFSTPFSQSKLENLINDLPNHNPVSLDSNGDRSPKELNWSQPTLIIVGSEKGNIIPQEISQIKVKIPMSETIDSLNVGTSVGIVLADYFNQTHH